MNLDNFKPAIVYTIYIASTAEKVWEASYDLAMGRILAARARIEGYNTMLAQSAYDGAAPRAMAIEDVPNAAPVHVFLRGNPNNPGPLAPPHFLSCLGGSEAQTYKDGRLDLAQLASRAPAFDCRLKNCWRSRSARASESIASDSIQLTGSFFDIRFSRAG